MRTTDLDYDFTADDVTDSDLIGYLRPWEIVEDPSLMVSRKRELLAFWASDIHAVNGSPALRSYAFGVSVPIDEILDALKALDDQFDLPPASSRGSSRTAA
jgi:hypothetical protein